MSSVVIVPLTDHPGQGRSASVTAGHPGTLPGLATQPLGPPLTEAASSEMESYLVRRNCGCLDKLMYNLQSYCSQLVAYPKSRQMLCCKNRMQSADISWKAWISSALAALLSNTRAPLSLQRSRYGGGASVWRWSRPGSAECSGCTLYPTLTLTALPLSCPAMDGNIGNHSDPDTTLGPRIYF